jgi:hypothetical protein
MQGWWNHGVHKKCLSMYCFFVGHKTPEHLGQVQSTPWQTNIHRLISGIPSISPGGLGLYFDSIDSKLLAYEGSTLLELTIWKLKITEQYDGNNDLLEANMKMACCIDSLSMVNIIVLNVLSFLNCDGNEGDDGNDDDDDEEEEEDSYKDN